MSNKHTSLKYYISPQILGWSTSLHFSLKPVKQVSVLSYIVKTFPVHTSPVWAGMQQKLVGERVMGCDDMIQSKDCYLFFKKNQHQAILNHYFAIAF